MNQIYFVHQLSTKDGHLFDFEGGGYTAFLVPLTQREAQLTVYEPTMIHIGAFRQDSFFPKGTAELEMIEYTVQAVTEKGGSYEQRFRHVFKTFVTLDNWLIESPGRLFKTMFLNDILRTRGFGDVKGLQFVA